MILDKLTSASKRYPESLNLKGRIGLFKVGILFLKFENDSASTLLDRLQRDVDSLSDPYLYNRLLSRKEYIHEQKGIEAQLNIINNIVYFEKAADSVSMAMNLIALSNRYNNIEDYQSALATSLRADSILSRIGYQETCVKNRVNRMVIYDNLGDTVSRNQLIRDLLGERIFEDNVRFMTVLLVNAYSFLGEPSYLHEAYGKIGSKPEMDNVRALIEAMLAKEYLAENRIDSASVYAERALSNLASVNDYSHRAEIFGAIYLLREQEGKFKEALNYYKKMKECEDSARVETNPVAFARMRYSQDMANHKKQTEQQKKETQLKWTVGVLASGLIVALVIIMLVMRSARLKTLMRLARKERDKSYRKAAVTMLSVTEKENRLKDMGKRIASSQEEGNISVKQAQQLLTALKMNMTDSTDWSNFAEYFSRLHPRFEDNLKSKYPSLTKKQLQMCCYMKMGLDDQRIAQVMNVKIESVWQTKWRIKQKMGLDSEDNLMTFLTGLE